MDQKPFVLDAELFSKLAVEGTARDIVDLLHLSEEVLDASALVALDDEDRKIVLQLKDACQRRGESAATRPATPASLVLSDPTIEVVARARDGDRAALEALVERSLPSLKAWAHRRFPHTARADADTDDLVQEAVLHVIGTLDTFEPRHVGAMQAYLRQSVINQIRHQVRRTARQPAPMELTEEADSDLTSPLEATIKAEAYERYRAALRGLDTRDREIIVARVEAQWSVQEIAQKFGMPTGDAARMAVSRALDRLAKLLATGT